MHVYLTDFQLSKGQKCSHAIGKSHRNVFRSVNTFSLSSIVISTVCSTKVTTNYFKINRLFNETFSSFSIFIIIFKTDQTSIYNTFVKSIRQCFFFKSNCLCYSLWIVDIFISFNNFKFVVLLIKMYTITI